MSLRTAIVVGGGPAGFAAANRLLDAGLSVTVLEARGASRRASRRRAVADQLAARAWDKGAELRCDTDVRSVQRAGDAWVVVTDAGERCADLVVFARGRQTAARRPASRRARLSRSLRARRRTSQ